MRVMLKVVNMCLECLKPPPNIKELCIEGNPGSSFPDWMQTSDPPPNCKAKENFPALQSFFLDTCTQLKTLPEELENLKAIKSLCIQGCDALVSLPRGLHKLASSSLELLVIRDCNCLRSLPKMGVQGKKSSLKKLEIVSCQELTSWFDSRLQYLTSLKDLCFKGCPSLLTPKGDWELLIALQGQLIKINIDDHSIIG